MTTVRPLASGAEARIRNEGSPLWVILVNGGTGKRIAGTWSATSELLAAQLAPRFADICFVEVRYRLKTWKELESCMEDAAAALDLAQVEGARDALLVGFSMGGAVSIGVSGHDAAAGVLGLAPWIPGQLSLDGLRGKRLDVVHGAWDRYLPGVPGVSPSSSRAGFERAQALGVEGTYTLIPGGLHGCAVRASSGRLVRLPRWRRWVEQVASELERFQSSFHDGTTFVLKGAQTSASLRRSS